MAVAVTLAMAVGISDLVAGDQAANFVKLGDTGLGEPGQIVPAVVDVRLEIAHPPAESRRDLGHDTPCEVLVFAEAIVPRREHRGVETLRMAVGISRERP